MESTPNPDLEKPPHETIVADDGLRSNGSPDILPDYHSPTLTRWKRTIESLKGFEARGISRVLPHEREAPSAKGYMQILLLWYGANITANNLVVGFLGPLLFGLGFLDCALIVVFACWVGSLGPSYVATFGPRSGLRTMARIPQCSLSPMGLHIVLKKLTVSQGYQPICHGILAFEADNDS